MDARQCMIIDLEKKGDKQMFVTEQVVHISENNNGLWAVKDYDNLKCILQ